MRPRCFLNVLGVTSPYPKSQRDYRDVDNVRESSSLSIDNGEDYDEYYDEYYEDYDYITNPNTFGTLKDYIFDYVKFSSFQLLINSNQNIYIYR